MPAYRPMPWFWWTTRSPTEISLRLFSASLLRFFFFCAPLTPKARAVNTAYFANGRLHPAESCPGRICTNPALGSAAASVVTFSPLVRRSAARPAAARGVPAMTVTAVPPLQSGWMSSSSAATSPPQAGRVGGGVDDGFQRHIGHAAGKVLGAERAVRGALRPEPATLGVELIQPRRQHAVLQQGGKLLAPAERGGALGLPQEAGSSRISSGSSK